MSAAELERVRGWLSSAQRVVVLTGAGISTESGIPDFRGPQGVWTKNPGAEKLSNLSHYMADKDVRRRAWQARLQHEAWNAQPNAGHRAMVTLEQSGKLHALITQNIDGLHRRAGSSPERTIEIHGTIHEVVCMACGVRGPMSETLDRVRAGEDDPPCTSCGGILKSATISFGQALVAEDLRRADRAARSCDLLIAAGSSLSVFPIAGVVPIAKQSGARVAILNGQPTDMDELADSVLLGPLGELLPALVSGLIVQS
ncbi:MAG TPA: Sir2 family NAD-dependent protein deacetylase [Polyangiales bacterium]|jgi:NAD-dependent deacetylase|nr:Sir2 family NAD-dependent protein deacetylase [Polyangiales bacterium]